MKTFLWTTLFWIVAAIAGLLCLGFGNLGTQVLENEWIVSFLPKNIQTKVCEPVVASALDGIDWCSAAEENDCNSVVGENDEEALSGDTEGLQKSLADLVEIQKTIYTQMQASFATTQQMINNLSTEIKQISNGNQAERAIVDAREQQKLQIQAQIEALQNEMANL